MNNERIKGALALITTSILWGSSFPAIKIIVGSISSYAYTWIRSVVAIAGLTPYLIYAYRRGRINELAIKGGLLAGLAYALGLWLQGLGTRYTTASNSAFITGLNTVFVHVYEGLILRRYGLSLALSLTLSITGLYFLTTPTGGLSLGDMLVLLGSFMWAAQVIIVGKYSGSDPLVFTFFEMMPAVIFIVPDLIDGLDVVSVSTMLLIVYLALVCSNAAFALQVYGQRYIIPSVAAITYLLEPVSAAIFAYVILNELFTPIQMVGASLILTSIITALMFKH